MSDFSINAFGSLTSKQGQTIKIDLEEIKKYDADGDNQISKSELETYVQSLKGDFDATEINKLFRALDADASENIDTNELAVYEKKIEMQDKVNEKIKEVAADTDYKQYAATIRDDLKTFLEEFIEKYTGGAENIVEDFTAKLEEKFEEFKANAKANDPETIKDAAQDKIIDGFYAAMTEENAPDEAKQRICQLLEAEADKFKASYKGDNFEADLKAHLDNYLLRSDAEKLAGAVDKLRGQIDSLGDYLSNTDFKTLKENVKTFLQEAIKQGVVVNLGGTNVASASAITQALAKFTTAAELKNAITEAMDNLQRKNTKELIIEEEIQKAEEAKRKAQEEAFDGLKGSDYQVNTGSINYAAVPGYYDNDTYVIKKHGWDGAKDYGRELLNNTLKEQFRNQIISMMNEKGIGSEYFDRISNVFENVWNSSVEEALNECVSGRDGSFFRKSRSEFNVPTLVNNFTSKFNAKIAAAIDEMNASKTDFDLQDINYSDALTDENGEPVKIGDNDASALLDNRLKTQQELTTVTLRNRNVDLKNTANQLINNMRSQMLNKAKAMCAANGIEFNNEQFTTCFENAKASSIAKNVSVKGIFSFSVQKMNTSALLQDFAQTFKDNFTTWVNQEKEKAKV